MAGDAADDAGGRDWAAVAAFQFCRSQTGRGSFFRNQQQTDRAASYLLRSRGT